ncbi:MAG: pyridoxine 5'-phosphate synthase [Vicinamibacterales bacterium]|jgi:pyridoxine 5-phosphate synthase|nr:pyridoxine 5'-phosphate synthase [Vicinamibacterales bacterium]|tara:strand:- start:388 stop:1131 length:744 start_codon:yes stop_codon:yes gene_type:complete
MLRMTRLSVNLNKVALLRNTRDVGMPDVVRAARIAVDAGAYGITVHPRPDERHTRPSDVVDLSAFTQEAGVEFNIEGNPTPTFLELVHQVVPAQCTLVPDSPDQRTSDHGWDLAADGARLRPVIADLKARGIRVSLFMDSEPSLIAPVAAIGADRIEIYTEPYAAAFGTADQAKELDACANCAGEAERAGLGVNAGHDLNLHNLPTLCQHVPGILEVSIGHALVADALELGLAETVGAYLHALSSTG